MDKSLEIKKDYKNIVDKYTPKSKVGTNSIWAFFVGGIICVIGEIIIRFIMTYGFARSEASGMGTIAMIFIGALLTGLDLYDEIGKKAGAGSIVPITGFANSIVSPAMEYKKEGYVMGVGAKMFTVAGPVIVYGTITSIIIGLIYYFFK